MQEQSPLEPPKDPMDKKDKNLFKEKWEAFKRHEKTEEIYTFAQTNTRDFIAYVLLVIGLVILLFDPFLGSLLIGALVGYYYSLEILFLFRHLNPFIEMEGLVRSLILGAALLTLFLLAPGAFIGAGLAILFSHFFPTSPIK